MKTFRIMCRPTEKAGIPIASSYFKAAFFNCSKSLECDKPSVRGVESRRQAERLLVAVTSSETCSESDKSSDMSRDTPSVITGRRQ